MLPLKRLAPYFARYRGRLVAGIASVFGAAVVGLASPLLIGGAVDSLRQSADRGTLLGYGGLLVAVTLVQGFFSFGQRRLLVTMSRNIEFDLRDDYFGHLQTLPLSFYRESYTGDLMARATNDLQAVRMICGPAIMYSANTVFTAVGALFFMARIHLGLSLVSLCALPLVAGSRICPRECRRTSPAPAWCGPTPWRRRRSATSVASTASTWSATGGWCAGPPPFIRCSRC
jgi:ATP-binding cassette subfamily B protein